MQKGEAIRKRIVETADALFYQRGFAHTSFADISDALGMSKGNFYYYFKTKDDILNAVIEKRGEDTRQSLAQWNNAEPDPRKRLKKYIAILTASQDMTEQYGCPMGSLCTELAKLHHDHLENASEIFEVYREWLEEQFKQLGHKKEARDLSLHLLSRGQGIALITNTYRDKSFLQREAAELNSWIDKL